MNLEARINTVSILGCLLYGIYKDSYIPAFGFCLNRDVSLGHGLRLRLGSGRFQWVNTGFCSSNSWGTFIVLPALVGIKLYSIQFKIFNFTAQHMEYVLMAVDMAKINGYVLVISSF